MLVFCCFFLIFGEIKAHLGNWDTGCNQCKLVKTVYIHAVHLHHVYSHVHNLLFLYALHSVCRIVQITGET